MSHDICRMGCCEASETAEAEIARLQRELTEAGRTISELASAEAAEAQLAEDRGTAWDNGYRAGAAQLAEMRAALTYCLEHGRVHGCHDLVDVARAALASTPDGETV